MADEVPEWIRKYNEAHPEPEATPISAGKWEPSPWAAERQSVSVLTSNTDDDPSKPVIRSKTFWYGIGIMMISMLGYFQEMAPVQSYPGAVSILGVLIGAGTIGLRFLTNQPIQPPTVVIKRNK
jgi:hypothetical protein